MTVPLFGVTESCVHEPFGMVSVTVCCPGATFAKYAWPLASFCAVAPPSSVNVNCATGVSAFPEGSNVSFVMSMHPNAGAVTVTGAVQVTVPPGPVAVPVKVALAVGDMS